MNALKTWLAEQGLAGGNATIAAALVAVVLVGLFSVLADLVTKRILLRLVKVATRRTETTWDDTFVEVRLFSRLSHLVPALIVSAAAPVVLADFPRAAGVVLTGTSVYMALVGMTVFDAFLNGGQRIYQGFAISRRFPIRTIVQIIRVAVYFVVGIAVLAILLGKSPVVFFSGLGAFTAVLLLIFKDTLLGFVAGIQLTANNMVREGDWIEMPAQNADGTVLDVSLTTVKVQNWDKTITTIPTYKLVEESFRNWRGMSDSGGRRIKRALHIDLNSIRFLTAEESEQIGQLELLADYMADKQQQIADYKGMRPDRPEGLEPTHRALTNVGTFRAYVLAYLRAHPGVHQEMTLLVRQLSPGSDGLPLEIYCFAKNTEWVAYEDLQADLFDHFFAIAPEFGLRIFQHPTGSDFAGLAGPRD